MSYYRKPLCSCHNGRLTRNVQCFVLLLHDVRDSYDKLSAEALRMLHKMETLVVKNLSSKFEKQPAEYIKLLNLYIYKSLRRSLSRLVFFGGRQES